MSANSVVHEFILKDAVTSVLQKIVKNSDAATDKLTKNLNKIDRDANKTSGSIGGLGTAFKGLAGLATAALAGIGIANFMTDSMHAAEHVQSMSKSFEALTKSADNAQQLVGLRKDLAKLPIPIQDADTAMKKLLASGITTRGEMGKVTTQLAAVSSATHQNLGEVSAIYEKIRNNGKLTGETLQQLMDRGMGAPIAKEIAHIMKISEHSVHEMVSKGKVSFDIFQKALDNTTTGTGIFAGVLDAMATTVEGKAAIVANKAQMIKESFGSVFLPVKAQFQDFQLKVLDKMGPVLDKIAKGLLWVIDNIGTILAVVAPLAAVWAGYTVTVLAHAAAIKTLTIVNTAARLATILLTGGFSKLNLVMRLNPVGLVISAITALVAIITIAWQKSETFRGIVLGTWEVMKDFASALGNMFTSPWETIKGIFAGISNFVKTMIAPLMETIDHIKNGRWLEAAKSSGKFLVNLTPVGMVKIAADKVKESGVIDKVKSSFNRGFEKGKDKGEVLTPESGANKDQQETTKNNHSLDLTGTQEKALSTTGTTKNITLNISNLIGQFSVTSNGVKESVEDIKKMITEALVDSARDAEISFG